MRGHGVPAGVRLLHDILGIGQGAEESVREIDQLAPLTDDRAQAGSDRPSPRSEWVLMVSSAPLVASASLRRWVRAVLVAAALVAVVSAGAPLSAAQDTATGVLLATMHLVTGATFLVTAWGWFH